MLPECRTWTLPLVKLLLKFAKDCFVEEIRIKDNWKLQPEVAHWLFL